MDQVTRRKLDRITNILWAGGVTNPVTYIDQLSYLIYLKLLDEEEANRQLQAVWAAGPTATASCFTPVTPTSSGGRSGGL